MKGWIIIHKVKAIIEIGVGERSLRNYVSQIGQGLPVKQSRYYEPVFFLGEHVAVPIVERLIHHSKLFMLGAESYRLKAKMEEG